MEQTNTQQDKNLNKKDTVLEKVFAVLMLVYLAVTIPLLCFVDEFTIWWFVFGLAFITIPFAVLYAVAMGTSKINVTQEQRKTIAKNTCIQISYLWLLDVLFMCIFNQWLVAIGIVGTLVIVINAVGLTNNFLGKIKPLKVFIPFDVVLTLGLGIYLIYIIPNVQLQQIVTTVASAFLGGALTLVGVAWTIKRQDEIRKQDIEQREKERQVEEKNKAKPIFAYTMLYEDVHSISGKKILMDNTGITEKFDCSLFAIIENSNHSVFTINRIHHDNKWYAVNGNKVFLPGSQVYINIKFSEPKDIYLEVIDSLQNKYYYQIFVLCSPMNNGEFPFIHTIMDIKELSQEESDNLFNQTDEKQ